MLPTKRGLTPGKQRLLELLQELNFGQVRDLRLKAGEPQFQPPPVIIKDWKLDGDNEARPELELQNFVLKTHHLRLFQVFDKIANGIVGEIHCRHGLPCKVVTCQPAA